MIQPTELVIMLYAAAMDQFYGALPKNPERCEIEAMALADAIQLQYPKQVFVVYCSSRVVGTTPIGDGGGTNGKRE